MQSKGNGTGNIVQTENQYPPTKQRYLVNLTATDGGQLKTTVKARIDTFTSTEVVVDFHLNIKLDEYNAKMATFLESLRKDAFGEVPSRAREALPRRDAHGRHQDHVDQYTPTAAE